MQQLLGIAEQETVGLIVELTNFLFDTAQKSQLIQMAQGEVGRLIQSPLTRAFLEGSTQQWLQHGIGSHYHFFTTLIGLAGPF